MHKMKVEQQNYAWFALADAEHCRLLCCRLTRQGTQHVDEYGAFENTLPEAEHARPMTGDGMTHDIEEEERRFGAQIVDWLRRKAEEHKISRMVIFAPPRMLGVLRKASSRLLAGHLKEFEGNLMRLDAGQLAQHPMVRDLVRDAHQRSLSGGSRAKPRQTPESKTGPRTRGEPVALVVRKAWRANEHAAGPANGHGSRGRHATEPGGQAGRRSRGK
jgi:protein required for attachment to host cells